MPPLPNTLYTRDTTCWLYGGVTFNPLYWPARQDETLLYKAIYTFHPDFVGVDGLVGRPRAGLGPGHLRGRRRDAGRQRRRARRDERAHLAPGDHARSPRRCSRRARPSGSSSPGCPSCARRCTSTRCSPSPTATSPRAYRDIVDGIQPFSLRPGDKAARRRGDRREGQPFVDVVAEALGLSELRVIETGGDVYANERQQWDSGNNAGGARAGRGRRLRPQHPHQLAAAQGRRRGDHHRRRRARSRSRWRSLHDLPASSATPSSSEAGSVVTTDRTEDRRR